MARDHVLRADPVVRLSPDHLPLPVLLQDVPRGHVDLVLDYVRHLLVF